MNDQRCEVCQGPLDPNVVHVCKSSPTQSCVPFGPEGFTDKGFEGYGIAKMPMTEQQKYETMWQNPNYRVVAPGEETAQIFLQHARPKPGSTVIDFGAGTGRGALMIAIMGNCRVHMVDFAANCLDEDVRNALITQAHMLKFTQHDLTQKLPFAEAYGYCTDVMEHIPEDQVPIVLKHILQAAQHVFFQISCMDDTMGESIGETLHMTVKPYTWWLQMLQKFECVVHWSQDLGGEYAMFYVTAWQDGQAITDVGVLNVEVEQVKANVRHNLQQDYRQATPHQPSDVEVCLLGGSPSLSSQLGRIKELKEQGCKIVTMNGAYKWAVDNGLAPLTQVVVDARPFNARFVDPVDEKNLYLIASQCDPSLFAKLPKDRVIIWNTTAETIRDILEDVCKETGWYGIPGGSTVLLRAIPLLRMLGFTKFHLFGCDSCLMGDEHHAYAQTENDVDMVMPVNVGGRIFQCHAWMVSQANEFINLIKVFDDEIQLEIYGDGLLAYILQHGADLADLEPLTEE